jgi:cation diffusion facilitator CzcD-associated flavoprotein CzcO
MAQLHQAQHQLQQLLLVQVVHQQMWQDQQQHQPRRQVELYQAHLQQLLLLLSLLDVTMVEGRWTLRQVQHQPWQQAQVVVAAGGPALTPYLPSFPPSHDPFLWQQQRTAHAAAQMSSDYLPHWSL